MRTGLRRKLLVGLGVTAVVGALALSRGDGAAQVTLMTLTLTPAELTPPGTVTARVTILPGVPNSSIGPLESSCSQHDRRRDVHERAVAQFG